MDGEDTPTATVSIKVEVSMLVMMRATTDSVYYTNGDTMHIGLDIRNPSESLQRVNFRLSLETSKGNFMLTERILNLPAGLDYTDSDFVSFQLPNLPPGTYTWHVILSNPDTGITICEDSVAWHFYRSLTRGSPMSISEMLEQATPHLEFEE